MKEDNIEIKYKLNLNLTPKDIFDKDFQTKMFYGYDSDEVDAFLDLIIEDYRKLMDDILAMQQVINDKYNKSDSNVNRYEFERLKQQVEALYQKLDKK